MASDKKTSWKRALLGNVLLIGFSLAIAVVGAEIAVRIIAPQQLIMSRPDLWQGADTVGWLRRPNINAPVNTGQGAVSLIADAEGFRVGTRGRSEGTPVLFLGDSFVEALQVEYEQTMTHLLEAGLTNVLDQPIAVRNAGIGGWSPSQYYLRARTLLAQDKYPLVITAIFVGNDAQPVRVDYFPPRVSERNRFRLPTKLSKDELINTTLSPVNDFVEERSHLYVMARKRLENVRMKAGLSPLYFPKEFLRSEANADRWTITADICRDIDRLAREHGARALFVLIPADFQVDREKFVRYVANFGVDSATVDLEQPVRRLTEEFSQRQLQFIDVLPRFRELHTQGQVLYGAVDPHLSASGHQAIAELLVPVAAQMLPAPPTSMKASGNAASGAGQ